MNMSEHTPLPHTIRIIILNEAIPPRIKIPIISILLRSRCPFFPEHLAPTPDMMQVILRFQRLLELRLVERQERPRILTLRVRVEGMGNFLVEGGADSRLAGHEVGQVFGFVPFYPEGVGDGGWAGVYVEEVRAG